MASDTSMPLWKLSSLNDRIPVIINLDYPKASATLRSRSDSGIQQQTALAIRSVIPAMRSDG